jgi:hypothetical protein
MVPGGFIDAAPEDQREYGRVHSIKHDDRDDQDWRIAMTWGNVRRLSL